VITTICRRGPFVIILWLAAILLLTACESSQRHPTETPNMTPLSTEIPQVQSVTIVDVDLNKVFYFPAEPVQISIRLQSHVDEPTHVQLSASVTHLANVLETMEEKIILSGGEQTIEITYVPPSDAPHGYGMDLSIKNENGDDLTHKSIAFDVLQQWTQSPRYGFLTDFFPDRSDEAQTMDSLTRYHINGLQFYDWMYRHDQFLTDQEPYTDPLGRQLSRSTVENLITAAHERNIAAMPYTAIYAASVPFYEQHPEWALYQANGKPYLLGDNFLVYMDPRPESPWVHHLLGQFDQVLTQMDFDGIHLDQYGDPKQGYDSKGLKFDLASYLAATINATKALVLSHQLDGVVVFNAVTNWPIEAVAPAETDFVYIEVWPPYSWFDDLHKLITQAQELGGGKPVVLAAYVDPALEHNVRLIDAVIFASGGGHIEMGELDGMLADPYFPKYKTVPFDFTRTIQHYYDFTVRYQDAIGPRTSDATHEYHRRIEMDGVSTQPNLLKNKVWPIVRESDKFTAISLVNLLGIDAPEWTTPVVTPPTPLGPTDVRISDIDQDVSHIWFATPDSEDLSLQPVNYSLSNQSNRTTLVFEIPSLAYWDLILIEWSNVR
jgi:dextranase